MIDPILVLIAILSYLVGSINLSIFTSKYIGKMDIRSIGSGNPGGTNVIRGMGAKAGILVMLAEITKGSLIMIISKTLFSSHPLVALSVSGVFCLLGNIFPLYHKFKGGKGVTVAGAFLVSLNPLLFVPVFGIFILVFALTRIVSLSSIVGVSTLAIFSCAFNIGKGPDGIVISVAAILIALIVIARHHANIKRIINKTENKFTLPSKK